MFWFTEGICFLPAFLVVWSSSNFIIPYIIAVLKRDVDIVFPYISDTGAYPPESCIFGLMTVITAFSGMATIYARFKFVEKLNEKTSGVHSSLNGAAFIIGMFSCLGMTLVATFQETTVTAAHDAGALLFFISGVLYTILQSAISYKLIPKGSSLTVCHVRAAIATIGFFAAFPTIVCTFFVSQTILHRNPEDKDYIYQRISAINEWIVAFSFVFFFLTYIQEFKLFTLRFKTQFVENS